MLLHKKFASGNDIPIPRLFILPLSALQAGGHGQL
jgi:hypothetical protein